MGVRRVLALATAALALAVSPALAGGRAGVRIEGPPFSLRGYVEETVFRAGPLEVTAGIDIRLPEAQGTPYTAAIYEGDGW